MSELTLRLRVAGNEQVEAALRSLQTEAKNVAATIEPLGAKSRTSMRAFGDLAATLSGTASVLRLVGAENKALDASVGAVITSLSLASTATSLYRNAMQLATVATTALSAASITLTAALGPLAIAVGIAAAAVWLFRQNTDESRRAMIEYEGALNAVAHAARAAAREVEAAMVKIERSPSEKQRSAAWEEAVTVGTRHAIQAIEEGWRAREEAQRRALAEAKRAAEKARAEEERSFQDQANQIVQFNIWQRQEWEKAAEARTKVTIAGIDKIIAAEEHLKGEDARIGELMRQRDDDNARAAADNAAARTRQAQQWQDTQIAALDAVRAAEDAFWADQDRRAESNAAARAAQAQRWWEDQQRAAKQAAEQIADFLTNTILEGFRDVLEQGKSIFEALSNVARAFFNEIARQLVSFGVRWFLRAIGLPLAQGGIVPGGLVPVFAGMQHGGRIDRPTLAFMGEGGQSEAVVPLPDNRSIPVKFTGDQGVGRELKIHFIVSNTWGDPSQVKTSPDEIMAVVVNDIARRGPIMRSIRMVIP